MKLQKEEGQRRAESGERKDERERERNKNFLGSVPRLSIKWSPRASTPANSFALFPSSLKASSTPRSRDEKLRERALTERSTRVLPALMETRSREPPLTAAKPIYLRPRFFLGFPPASLLPSRSQESSS